MKKIIFLFIVLSFYRFISVQAQPRTAVGTISYPYQVDTLQSERLNEKRVIKIFLPEGFQKENHYPFLFTLDESWMSEQTVSTVKQLMDFDLIPPVIVIGP
jgi:predicted alpha/beta superfamily hydrolase